MTPIPITKPEDIGIIPARWQRAGELLKDWTNTGKVPAAALCVGRKGRMLEPLFFGKQRPDANAPLRKDALFLIASITKPVTATAVMMLLERGLLRLEDAVRKITSLNAEKIGILDRGLLRSGQYADVTIFDAERVVDKSTYTEPFQYSEGIAYVIVNGQLVLEQGKHLGVKSGRALRHQLPLKP